MGTRAWSSDVFLQEYPEANSLNKKETCGVFGLLPRMWHAVQEMQAGMNRQRYFVIIAPFVTEANSARTSSKVGANGRDM